MKKTVLITGATSGIGLAILERYLELGAKVIATGRSKDKIDNLKNRFKHNPNFLLAELIDVKEEESMQKFILSCDDKYKIDIIIANAGISAGIIGEKDIDSIAKDIFQTNVFGVFNTIHPMISRMQARKSGDIVLISSMSAFFGLKSALFYASSKSAIKSYGEGLRLLLKEYNINVTTVFPGFVDSNITQANTFKMPFFMEAKKASSIIIRGIKKKKGFIIFPLRMYCMVYLISILPFFIREKILEKLPNK